MDRAEGLYRFYVQQLEEGIKDLKGWDIHCRQQQEVFKREMDATIQRIKESVGRRALFCIHLCLFRSDYIFRKGKASLYAYGHEYLLEKEPVQVEIHLKGLMEPLWEFEDRLISLLADYKNVLTKNDVQVLMQSEYVPLLIDALEWLFKYYIRENKALFLEGMELEPDFRITVGEYQSRIKEVYITEPLDDEGMNLEQLFKAYPEKEDLCCYKCSKYARASNLKLCGTFLIMSRFEQGDFTGTDFTDCYAMDSEWNGCLLRDTVWKNAKLFGAAFRFSDLQGADFRGAKIWDTDFTGASLKGARFDRENQQMGNLDPEQRREIEVC